MEKDKKHKVILNIDNNRFIFNINLSTTWTWYVTERKNQEEIHLPVAITFSRIYDQPVFRLLFFKLMIELAIKHHE